MLIWKNKLHEKLGCGIPDLVVKVDKTGPQICLDNAANIEQTFNPKGSLVKDSSRMVYEAEQPGGSGHTWYFYEMTTGEWEFTWDTWLKESDIDTNEYGTPFETPYKDPTSEFESILEKWTCVKKIQEVFENE